MTLQASESLIIKQIDFKDNDKIITFLTKDQGKKSGMLKGAKKIISHNVGISEPFTHVNISYMEKASAELVRIRKFDLLNSFYPIRQGYHKILFATYFTELIHLCVIDPQDSCHFFDLLLAVLQSLQHSKAFAQIKIQFERNLLGILGISPNLEQCAQCRRPLWKSSSRTLPQLIQIGVHQLDCPEGGIRCPQCALHVSSTVPLSPGTLSYLRALEQHVDQKNRTTPQNSDEWDLAFLTYFRYHCGKTPKSHALLKR